MLDFMLVDRARRVALSLDDVVPANRQARRLLLDLASRVNALTVKVEVHRDGLWLVNGHGVSRRLTKREWLAYELFEVTPRF